MTDLSSLAVGRRRRRNIVPLDVDEKRFFYLQLPLLHKGV